jgi:biopolymer transport protein ExbB
MLWDNNLTQLFAKGGLVMWPLLACSVIGLAIVAERLVFFMRMRLNFTRFMAELLTRLRRGDLDGARAGCRSSPHPVSHIARVYLENMAQPDALRDDILRREGSQQLEQVEKRLRGLSAVAHIAPLLGLLGTVTGLVGAFHRIEKLGGVVQPGDLAGGIWEALLTTVFGLIIAIPCMVAYHAFEHKADEIARRMQFTISQLNEFFGKTNGDAALRHAAPNEELTGVR